MLAFDINVIIVKSLQVIVFGILTFTLIRQHCKGEGSIGLIPVVISISLILNGAASIVQTVASDPYHFNDGI